MLLGTSTSVSRLAYEVHLHGGLNLLRTLALTHPSHPDCVQQVVTHTWRATGENCTAPPKQTQGRWLLSNHVSTTC